MAKGILALIGKPKKGGDPEEEGLPPLGGEAEEDSDMGDAKTMAAEDAMAAFKSGDVAALSDALTRHYEACASEGGL